MVDRRVESLSTDEMAGHLARWSDLQTRCLEPNVFNEPAFALPAAQFISSWPKPRFLLVWDADSPVRSRLLGLCCIVGGYAGSAAAWMHTQSTAAFPLLDRECAAEALSAMLAELTARRPTCAALLIQGLPAGGPTAALLSKERSWRVVAIESRTRAILAGQAGSTPGPTKELRRQRRRLDDRGEVRQTSATTPEAVGTALDAFFTLEANGWKGRRKTALSQSHALSAFTRSMMRGLAQSGQCRIESLDLDGKVIAAGMILRSGDRAYFWKTAYDEALRKWSPGVQLALAITVQQQSELGLDFTDSCAVPHHAMIDRLWPERGQVVDLMVGDHRIATIRFALAVRLERWRRALKQYVRDALAGARKFVDHATGR